MNVLPKHRSSPSFNLSPIKEIELAAAKRPGVISLAQGIPSFRTPEVIIDYVQQKIREGACDKYSLTTGLAELREEIALALEGEGLRYDADREIIVTAGSIEGITASILALTQPGDEVLIPSPTYASYLGAISLARCTPRYVDLDEDRNFDFDVSAIERCITRKTRVLLYCSPNNPTGTLYSEAATRELVRLAEKHNVALIIDEVYKDFYYTDDLHFTPALITEARPRIVRVCSFSKAYAMTGWRVGFLHADAAVTEQILKYHDAMVTCAPVVSQYAAIAALRYGSGVLKTFRNEYRSRRDLTLKALDRMSVWLDYQVPKATYFAFPRIKDTVPLARDSRALAYDILEKINVALVPGVAFGPSGESHLRICYSRDEAPLAEALERLQGYFSGARAQRTTTIPVPRQKPRSFKRRLLALTTGVAARLYLARKRPIVIGIVGTRGKTVFKRTILELLERHAPSRAGILSYNTEIGLPLSILDLHVPKSTSAKLLFPFKIVGRLLGPVDRAELLVLEFGIQNVADARELLSLCRPDWLLVSDLEPSDPSLDHPAMAEGIRWFAERIGAEKTLWTQEAQSEYERGVVTAPGAPPIPITREAVSQSERAAIVGATKLGLALGIDEHTLRGFVSQRRVPS